MLTRHFTGAAVLIAGLFCWLVLAKGLLAPVLFGSLVFLLTRRMAAPIQHRFGHGRAHVLALAVVAMTVISVVTVALMASLNFSSSVELQQVTLKLSDTVAQLKTYFPAWADAWLPDNLTELQSAAARQLKAHAASLSSAGFHGVKVAVEMLVCAIIGAMLAVSQLSVTHETAALTRALIGRFSLLHSTFAQIVTAQTKISALNSVFTAVYLLGVLPLFDVHLPYAKTLVVVTFICGLLPVVGNLLSNTAIVLVSLSVSFGASMASLAFLVGIHKVEYFLNARIIGGEVGAKAWELLIAMLVGEALFGLAGVVAAPILYGYVKRECQQAGFA